MLFVTNFVTRITNFVTCVRSFVTCVTNFVTNFFCADNENLQGERKKMLRESKKSEAGRDVFRGAGDTETGVCYAIGSCPFGSRVGKS